MTKRIGLFSGSFDPITNGHLDLIERASKLFDQLYIGIFYNQEKKGFFTLKERERAVQEAVAHLKNVSVVTSSNELGVRVAERLGVTHLVRGLRNSTDLDYELNLEFYNRGLSEKLETIYLTTPPEYREISSTRIRELIHFGASIRSYVPNSVCEVLKEHEQN